MKTVQIPNLKARITTIAFSVFLAMVIAPSRSVALADGALTNGATHTGVIEIGGLDTWTFTAAKNDSITVSIGEVAANEEEPNFYPWIHLHAPDGSDLGSDGGTTGDWGTNTAAIDVRALLTGTYTVLVSDYPYQIQAGPGTYVLTLAKSPDPFTISPGDEGGSMTNAVSHTGTIGLGDLDTWVFQATKNGSITINIGEAAVSGEDLTSIRGFACARPMAQTWAAKAGPEAIGERMPIGSAFWLP